MESDGEIEYLDEDADIVQQCVQTVPETVTNETVYSEKLPLLVERPSADRKRKRKKEEQEDSDYDPNEDILPNSPDSSTNSSRSRKRKVATKKTARASINSPFRISIENSRPSKKDIVIDLNMRKKMDIKIPDYEDPLCLPVRALKSTMSDIQRLKTWNNVCLEHFRRCDTLLRPEKGPTQSSTRTVVLRNVVHKDTGKTETAVWSKTCVINKQGVKKSEIFQSILPKYREKKILNTYNLLAPKKPKKFHHIDDALLTKEEYGNKDVLVVYKPKEALSAVYKFIDTDKREVPWDEDEDDEARRGLAEAACCRACARCYQASWRGAKKDKHKKIQCPICARSTVSVYNLLTHLKAHSQQDVHRNRRAISVTLAGVVDYHYRCRVCQEQFLSIRSLRQHVAAHKGSEIFRCELGNHLTS